MSDQVDHSRRRLLTLATAGTGAVGIAFAAVPFLASWNPSARAKAAGAPVEVDISKLETGQMMKVVWRGQAVYVLHRTKEMVALLSNHDNRLLDPLSESSTQPDYIQAEGADRSRRPDIFVAMAVCTHLGCSPLGALEPNNAYQVAGADLGPNWPGGFYCPCHGSKFDLSGRVFKGVPAPKNLAVPPYVFAGDSRIVIGLDNLQQKG